MDKLQAHLLPTDTKRGYKNINIRNVIMLSHQLHSKNHARFTATQKENTKHPPPPHLPSQQILTGSQYRIQATGCRFTVHFETETTVM